MLGSDKSFVHSEERTHGPGFRGKFGTTRLSCLVHSIRALKIESVAHQANYAGNDLSSNFDRRKSEIISMITRDNQPLFRIRNSLSLSPFNSLCRSRVETKVSFLSNHLIMCQPITCFLIVLGDR